MRVGLWKLGLIVIGLLGAGSMFGKSERPAVKSEMAGIFTAMTKAWEASINLQSFSETKQQETVRSYLQVLAKKSAALEKHLQRDTAGFQYLAETLAADAKEAADLYDLGKFNEAQFIVQNMVADCMACHSRLPAKQSDVGAAFADQLKKLNLPTHQLANMLVATRQFDKALEAYETIILDKKNYQSGVIDLSVFTDYLTTAIRVQENFDRATRVLGTLSESYPLPAFMRQDVVVWMKALAFYGSVPKPKDGRLKEAKRIIDEGKSIMAYPMDRSAMVHFLVASALLHQFLEQKTVNRDDIAETYFLLGTTELLVGKGFWLSEATNFLEAAVLSGPGTQFSKQAYALLEEQTLIEFSGSGGTDIPEPVRAKMKRLKSLSYGKE